MVGLKYSYFVNDNRYHGFTIDVKQLKGWLVIAADFAITEDEMQALVDNDVCVLSTDHHECQSTFIDVRGTGNDAQGIVINNQYPFEPGDNRYQSGAGVFYELACELFPEFKDPVRDALVGVTLLSDLREIENAKARKYLKKTFSADNTEGYIAYLINSCVKPGPGFGTPKFDRNFIDYTLSPTINALLRANKTSDAINFILGRGLKNHDAKGFQKMLLQEMYANCDILEFAHYTILAIDASHYAKFGVNIAGYIGLFCNDYKDKNGNISTLGVVRDNGRIIRASFRGKYNDIHYQSGFRNKGIHAEGHAVAFGITEFYLDQELAEELDELIGNLEEKHTVTAKIINVSNMSVFVTQRAGAIATENCYVRDMYRTYVRYTGKNIRVERQSYKTEELTLEDMKAGVLPELYDNGVGYRYVRDKNGQPVTKYIRYRVDGQEVLSFGVDIHDGLILPVMERGYVKLYVRGQIE